jgi:cell division protein FtsI/penicillin-binding protein 2
MQDQSSWRLYQRQLKKQRLRRDRARRLLRLLFAAAVLVFVIVGIGSGLDWIDRDASEDSPVGASTRAVDPASPDGGGRFDKARLHRLLSGSALMNLDREFFATSVDGKTYVIDTSLDMSLQTYLMSILDRRHARHIGIVAMEPDTGRILALVGYNKRRPGENPCTDTSFPAASIFKIVTAAAAIEALGLNGDSVVVYNGRKHTLYKSQLKDRRNRYTHKTTLRESFAQSINPVFGKLGANQLGKQRLLSYGEAFGFNRRFRFAVPLPPSTLRATDEPYQWAELASGFNRQTRLTPVHGAMIAAVVLNDGRLVEPYLVDELRSARGEVLYQARTLSLNRVLSKAASRQLAELMQATVVSGTSRKAFRGYQNDYVLSKLTIGGKTGSINTQDHDARIDWFVGFARANAGSDHLAVAVLVAHEEYIGVRASQYARKAIKQYFRNVFAEQKKASREVQG